MKKKMMIGMIAVMLTLGSVHTYAATVLDINIISLITNGISTIFNHYNTEAATDSENLNNAYRNKITQYVDKKTTEVNTQIDAHVTKEINRADKELNSYYQSLTSETDQVVKTEINDAKAKITDNVNKDIANIKNELAKELEKNIKEKLK